MLRRFLFLIPIFAAAQSATNQNQTSLDRYVHARDPVYGWKLVDSLKAEGVEADVLELTSQTWRTAKDVDKPVWKHWLILAPRASERRDILSEEPATR